MAKKAVSDGVSKDMTLGEIVTKYPEAVEVMYGYGLHCIGCHVAYSETLEEGSKAHGFDEKQITEMVQEINKKIKAQKEPKKA